MLEECPNVVGQEVTVVAHCLLNHLTRLKGLSPVTFSSSGPLVQLPCPEALYLGLDRWAVTKNQMDVPQFRRFCRRIIEPYADILEMLAGKGALLRLVGLAGSPTCGVETTSRGYSGGRVREQAHEHISGRGIFMEELLAELERRKVPFRTEEAGGKESACGLLDREAGEYTNTVK